jgi:WhiB family redox-sensing transcriptional regulator
VSERFTDAACARVDPELFHLEQGQSPRPAKRICADCPVLDACRSYALARPELLGIWGGLTEPERRALRSRRPGEMGVAA